MKRPPPLIDTALMALVAYLLIFRWSWLKPAWGELPYLPFLSWLDQVPTWLWCGLLLPILYAAPLAIVFAYRSAAAARILGVALLLMIVSSMPLFGNSATFMGCLFLLAGCYRAGPWIFRWQLLLLYGGAAFNKFFSPDWWNGHYFDFFGGEIFAMPYYSELQSIWPDIATWAGIAIIFMELSLGLLLFFRSSLRWGIVLGLAFHLGMLLLTRGRLSFHFFWLAGAAYLLALHGIPAARGPKWWQSFWNLLERPLIWGAFFVALGIWKLL